MVAVNRRKSIVLTDFELRNQKCEFHIATFYKPFLMKTKENEFNKIKNWAFLLQMCMVCWLYVVENVKADWIWNK